MDTVGRKTSTCSPPATARASCTPGTGNSCGPSPCRMRTIRQRAWPGICAGPAKPTTRLLGSGQINVKLQIAGLSSGYHEVIKRGDTKKGRSFSLCYLRNGRLLAVDAVNRPRDFQGSPWGKEAPCPRGEGRSGAADERRGAVGRGGHPVRGRTGHHRKEPRAYHGPVRVAK